MNTKDRLLSVFFGRVGHPEDNTIRVCVGLALIATGIVVGTLYPEHGILSITLALAGIAYAIIQATACSMNPPK